MTDQIVNRLAEISEQVGRITVLSRGSLNPHLRRENRIKTIHSSLAIEHNSLSLDQVTAILDGKRILGNPNEIREVKNAYDAYEMMLALNPFSVKDLLKAHKVMMQDLISENGRFRTGSVGIFDGETLVHMAPPADLVPKEIQDLFDWYQASEMHPLIKSAVFHYEFEFIHPFADGNGRIGRMWHSMLLGKWNELFYWLPIEELIRNRQQAYYHALGQADREADSAAFVELMLNIILDTLKETTVVGETQSSKTPKHQPNDVLDDVLTDRIMAVLKENPKITQRDLAKQLRISYRSVQKYMKQLQEQGLITRVGGKRYGHWEVVKPRV